MATTVTVPRRDLRLALAGTGSLAGTTRGLTEGAFTLEVSCTESRGFWKQTEERFLVAVDDGRYRVDGVPACAARVIGRNSLRQTLAPGGSWAPNVTIPPGGVGLLDLDLTPLLSKQVHGRVRDARGAPVDRALVRVVDQARLHTLTDADGAFSISAAPGAHLVVTGGGVSQTLELPTDDLAACDVDIVLDSAVATRR